MLEDKHEVELQAFGERKSHLLIRHITYAKMVAVEMKIFSSLI